MSSNPADDSLSQNTAPGLRANPVDLRWDAHDASILAPNAKVTLPLNPATEGNLEQLIKDMQPATFGRGDKHVFDASVWSLSSMVKAASSLLLAG